MIKIPDISKQIYKEQIFSVLENKYSTMGPMWVSHQMEWLNGVYASFKDHDKFLIVIYLIKKTLDFYSENFTKLTFDYFYSKETVEIEKYTITEISKALNIPKESTRRKVLELEKMGAIRKFKKKIIIDRSRYYHSKPVDSIKRITRFLSILSEMSIDSKILPKKLSSGELEIIIKDNFSYIWKLYYELQIPMMISYKKIFKDLETFHIFATCVVNQHLYVKKISKDNMKRDIFIESTYTAKMMQGLNAMSISDITGIPRATVIRKLRKLVKRKILIIDIKKHYRLTGNFVKKLKPMQKDILIKLSSFSSKIFNLAEF
jgi:DNA-binding Lrp family transcriptional regulator